MTEPHFWFSFKVPCTYILLNHQPRHREVVKAGSDSSIAERSALVWVSQVLGDDHYNHDATYHSRSRPWVPSIGRNLQSFADNGIGSIWAKDSRGGRKNPKQTDKQTAGRVSGSYALTSLFWLMWPVFQLILGFKTNWTLYIVFKKKPRHIAHLTTFFSNNKYAYEYTRALVIRQIVIICLLRKI